MTLRRLFRGGWTRPVAIWFGLLCLSAAIWFGGPMTGLGWASGVRLRVGLIAAIWAVALTVVLVRWRIRRRRARTIEEALTPEPAGDGKVLAERMSKALAVLKKSGGGSYLYDLPWYVIIGPPGAGKTTALVNSGIEFPMASEGAVEGFGGTRNCDFWFAEDAVLIDTAGRYTTQDSDARADGASWQSFLGLLKKSRPNQPINGVILAFSAEDMMTMGAGGIAAHAETVRARLAEVHETLKIDFPVYVMFTKADLIAGFREYFASFSASRRRAVWGVTFQTRDRKALTYEAVPAEFDRLIRRLSDEEIDRLNEEPDGISRIAIFGLPGQMAMLKDNVSEFLRLVFQPTRYRSNAVLRGFYFTSGTQEGTPIDQVLGAMSREVGSPAFSPAFLSGKGKSFFIHDLLRRVIFPEAGWVSHDRRAVRRTMLWRGGAVGVIAVATVALLAGFGWSFWRNDRIVRMAEAETQAYAVAAGEEIRREPISDTDPAPVLPHLNQLATMQVSQEGDRWEGMGLGQRERLQAAARQSYSDAMERMLRPRLVLALEAQMPEILREGDTTRIYRALKVYMLLGGQGARPDDAAILTWFDESWREEYTGRSGLDLREQLMRHLAAMLQMDDDRNLLVTIDQQTVDAARAAIVQMPVADQAWALIADGAAGLDLPEWQVMQAAGPSAAMVFATRDGSDLGSVTVPGLFTYEGFWSYFFPQLDEVAERLRQDRWVLGEAGEQVMFEQQLDRLDRVLMDRYRTEFQAAWGKALGNLTLTSMSADPPRYDALGAAASGSASPLLLLARSVEAETRLSREFDGLDQTQPSDEGVTSDVGKAALSRLQSRTSGVQRILMDAMVGNAKAPGRAVAGGDDGSITAQVTAIEAPFQRWFDLLKGDPGRTAMDTVLGNLGAVWNNMRLAQSSPDQSAAMQPQLLNALTQYNSQLPEPMAAMITSAEEDFRAGSRDADLAQMNRALSDQITFFCRETVAPSYPFAQSSRAISIEHFARFFGPGGDMDRFFNENLRDLVERTPNGLQYRADLPLAERLNANTLLQFERAERIRQAFFPAGGSMPEVEITLGQVDAHPSVDRATLMINDTRIDTVTNALPKTITWPGAGRATLLQLYPERGRDSQIYLQGSSWTFIDFLAKASARSQAGDRLRATWTVGGRFITYDITINAPINPFTMSELREFECPVSLD